MELTGIDFLNYLLLAIVGIVILLNIIFSAIVATIAERRNQSWGLYFVVGLIFGFHITLLFVLLHDAINRHWRAEDNYALEYPEENDQERTLKASD